MLFFRQDPNAHLYRRSWQRVNLEFCVIEANGTVDKAYATATVNVARCAGWAKRVECKQAIGVPSLGRRSPAFGCESPQQRIRARSDYRKSIKIFLAGEVSPMIPQSSEANGSWFLR